jgi:hypothetical protein
MRKQGRSTAGGGAELAEKETEEEVKWDASRDFSAITENTGTSL